MTHTHFKYCQYDEFVIPLLLNDVPLLIGRIVFCRRQHISHMNKLRQHSPFRAYPFRAQPLLTLLSYFFLLKNLLVLILSIGNMYLHYQDCRKRRACEKQSESTPAQLDNVKPTPPIMQLRHEHLIFGYLPQKRFLQVCNYLSWIMGSGFAASSWCISAVEIQSRL